MDGHGFNRVARRLPLAAALTVAPLMLTGCSGWLSLWGILVPAWMVSLVLGIAGAWVSLHLLKRSFLRDVLPPPALTFTCLMIIYSTLLWLIFFRD